ncbi:hypothetical protein NIES2111_53880 [Nostoc sp. NIES-2111]|nr:hypothetical protein NIES2111_53880 [Nostoc sp. NIES-2111]
MEQYDFYHKLIGILVLLVLLSPFALAFYFGYRPYAHFEQTQSQIKFKIKPRISRVIATFSLSFSLVVLIATLASPQLTKITCIHQETFVSDEGKHTSQCQLVEIGLINKELSKKTIDGITKSQIETIIESDDDGKNLYDYQLMFVSHTSNIPFRSINYSKYKLTELQSIEAQINSFLINLSEKELSIIEDSSSAGYLALKISIFLFVLFLLIYGLGVIIEVNVNKESNTIIISRYQWWGKLGKTTIQHPLTDLKDVKIKSTEHSDTDPLYYVALVLNSDEIIPLIQVYSSNYWNIKQLVDRIMDFLRAN